ncbi:MAG TPA: hypothetical protein VIV65_08380 [Gemmatimonadaceae bacterium]|jgi:hypothetical protein
MRVLGIGSAAAIVGIVGVAGAITIRGDAKDAATRGSAPVALKQEGTARHARGPRPLTPVPVKQEVAATAPATSPSPAPTPAPPASRVSAQLGEGRTSLTDSIYAVRSGDSVLVSFDTHGNRTRRADKLEQMIRTTLPMVYGRRAEAALDSVPVGSLLPSRDVVGVVMEQGLRVSLEGQRLWLRPQTRETSDGPLVVAYLVVVER